MTLHGERELPKDAREAEAELSAYLCKSSLGQTDGLEYSRGYLQSWMGPNTRDKIRFGKVFSMRS